MKKVLLNISKMLFRIDQVVSKGQVTLLKLVNLGFPFAT